MSKKQGYKELGKALLESLKVIRIYTKDPGSQGRHGHPFVMKYGATINDLARNIHKEMLENFMFAMVWAKRLPFSPKKVGMNFVLDDGDIVEIHTRV